MSSVLQHTSKLIVAGSSPISKSDNRDPELASCNNKHKKPSIHGETLTSRRVRVPARRLLKPDILKQFCRRRGKLAPVSRPADT